jgi:hypothetical protein
MASDGSGSKGTGKAPFGRDKNPCPNVSELLQRLNLTEEEGVVTDFSDDEDLEDLPPMAWAVVGKVLSPMAVHVNTVRAAMKPA